MTQPILDVVTLDANTMADPALQAELFELYFDHAPKSVAQMRSALSGGAHWAAGAHALKGTARTLGFLALGEAAAEAEKLGPSAERLARLETLLQEARKAADAHLASVAA